MISQPHPYDGFAWLGAPLDARALFAPERAVLLAQLRGLAPDDWNREAVPGWSVRDLVAHLLGDDYGRISRDRDGHRGGPGLAAGETLEAYIHRLNQQWVDACARLSPAVLTQTLELTGAAVADLFRAADLHENAPIGVSWAGAEPAPAWLDCAREFTEHWVHRQQIRHATGQPTDPDPRPLAVVIDTFARALPHTLRDTAADPGTQVRLSVPGPAGGEWTATAGDRGWSLAPPASGQWAATVRLDAETTWRVCVRGIEPADALARGSVEGDQRLAAAVCQLVSIIR
ncbi:maleylpyruvate isomerase family mycothiol-dependent enzyme [Streptomyces zagrosensis]|uniref:Uncharacterized protein (TIGR03083 family) n=1 Tax=Streptomyces zagrosensis TaxID=1042984 RepID=A0A7W9QE44_9ACTN|nr:maleylpyruvate isomerase family mycothiol-dependent enzyme [Streptomyces zagrosensis]MBB5938329.1 uncharacterized protein (TIGR03083 family) [Streptomyces zagrosensis]